MAQSGSAPGWGPGGRRFKSCLPDCWLLAGDKLGAHGWLSVTAAMAPEEFSFVLAILSIVVFGDDGGGPKRP